MFAERQRVTTRHAAWTLRKALSRLGYSLQAHAETPGELYVYPKGGAKYAGPNDRLWHKRRAKRRAEPEPPNPKPPPKRPTRADGIYQHGALCDCAWCEGAGPSPRYVKLRGSA